MNRLIAQAIVPAIVLILILKFVQTFWPYLIAFLILMVFLALFGSKLPPWLGGNVPAGETIYQRTREFELSLAIRQHDYAEVRKLLEKGADPFAPYSTLGEETCFELAKSLRDDRLVGMLNRAKSARG